MGARGCAGPAQGQFHGRAGLFLAGYGVHSSKTMTMSEPSARCTRMDSSGARNTGAVHRRAESTPSSVILRIRQAEHLKAAGIGQYRAVPVHEAVQAAVADEISVPGRSHK